MTLRNLAAAGLVDVGTTRVEHTRRRALAFVLDESFLRAFKVLLYSLVATRSVLDLPVLVYTQDRKVYDDPVVKAVADRRVFITDDDIAQFGTVSRENVRKDKQLSWIAKYTFLKWMIFDDHDVDDLLFIDADIVALTPCDTIFDDAAGVDMGIAPRFLDTLSVKDGKPRPPEDVLQNFQAMIDGNFPKDHIRINSGVMVLSGTCLTKGFRQKLLDMTRARDFTNEQSYVSEVLETDPDVTWRMLSSKYNFNARELKRATTPDQLSLLSQTVFLHYVGKIKPWTRPVRNNSKTTKMIWRHYETEALDRSELLGKHNPAKRLVRDWI